MAAKMLATIRAGYNRRSLGALAVLIVLYALVTWVWQDVFDFSTSDWFFASIWIAMSAILCFRVDATRDVPRALVGLFGGLAIEAWGTATELWKYETHERPPFWIVPAWPVATLAIDRLGQIALLALPRRAERITVPVLLCFSGWMTWFARATLSSPMTWLVCAVMIAVGATSTKRRHDLALFAGGTVLGVFLEYWGTSRGCWTYWTQETPPIIAAFAHGFASVAFQRGIDLMIASLRHAPWNKSRLPPSSSRRRSRIVAGQRVPQTVR